MELIDKSALVSEIDDMLNTKEHTSHCDEDSFNSGRWKALTKVKDFINALAVVDMKDVDLEKEIENLIEKEKAFVTENREVKYYNGDSFNHIYELEFIAKHFFELGLKAQKGE